MVGIGIQYSGGSGRGRHIGIQIWRWGCDMGQVWGVVGGGGMV